MSEVARENTSEAITGRRTVNSEPAGRDWAEIGFGALAALAVIGMYLAGIWAVWVIAEALI